MFPDNFGKSHMNPRQMRINGRCPVCQAMYDFQQLHILGEKDQNILVYMQCSVCKASIISILSLDPRGMSARGVVTDLSPEEIYELETGKPITSDDILELHEFLEKDKPIDNFIS